MKKIFLLVAITISLSNFVFGQAFTKAEKEVFYQDYMKELNKNTYLTIEEKENYCYCFLTELNKIDRKVYENMIDFEKKMMMVELKKRCNSSVGYKTEAQKQKEQDDIAKLRQVLEEANKKRMSEKENK